MALNGHIGQARDVRFESEPDMVYVTACCF
jgi:hypothetical protein